MKEVKWVSIEVIDPDGKILFIEEAEDKPWKNKWQISVPMWTVEKWEDPLETVIRELREETWLIIDKGQIENKWKFWMYVNNWEIFVEMHKFIVRVDDVLDTKNFQTEEISKVFWWKKWDLKWDLKWDNLKNIRPWTVETLLEKNDYYNNIVFIKNWVYYDKFWNIKKDLDNL